MPYQLEILVKLSKTGLTEITKMHHGWKGNNLHLSQARRVHHCRFLILNALIIADRPPAPIKKYALGH